jgi:hypothetical protein
LRPHEIEVRVVGDWNIGAMADRFRICAAKDVARTSRNL